MAKNNNAYLNYLLLGIACVLLIFSTIQTVQVSKVVNAGIVGTVTGTATQGIAAAPSSAPRAPQTAPQSAPTMVGGC